MSVSNMFFSPSDQTEFHLVPGSNLDLGARLLIDTTTGFQHGNAFADPGSVLRFRAMVKDPGGGGATLSNAGITLNTANGMLNIWAALPLLFKSNFVVEAEITQAAVGGTPAPPPMRAFVRVHIHRSVRSIWLTPSRLRVMRTMPVASAQITSKRFRLRAMFDDGLVGDITDHGALLSVVWSNGGDGHITIPGGTSVGASFPITATIGGLTANADVDVIDRWSSDPNIRAHLVPGGAVESHASPNTANVIFLSEGFADTERGAFDTYVNGLVAFMSQPLNTPYQMVKSNMAFWSVFIGRPTGGVSTGGEVYPYRSTAGTFELGFVPHPERPRDDYAADHLWSIEELIYMVGLPMPADAEGAGRSDEDIMSDWRALCSVDPTAHLGRATHWFRADDRGLLPEWRQLAGRAMIDDVDSALGLRAGRFPADDDRSLLRLDGMRMRRTGDDGLNGLFHDLVSDTGTVLQGVWESPVGTPDPFSNRMVCIVSSSYGRAVNETSNGFFHINQHEMHFGLKATRTAPPVAPPAGMASARFTLVPTAATTVPDEDKARTFVHEFTHSFFIDDEYGEADTNEPRNAAALDLTSANLQVDDSAMRGAVGHREIHGEEIKWRWHRIRIAATVNRTITIAGDRMTIGLVPGQGRAFRRGSGLVILRSRTPAQPLQKLPPLSEPLFVEELTDDQMIVSAVGANYIYDGTIVPWVDIPASFLAGSVAYEPMENPLMGTDPTHPFLELVAANVRNAITARKAPLTRWPTQRDDRSIQQPDLSGVTLPDCYNRNRSRVVGLYSGGDTYHRGVFHPAGHCLMREDHTNGMELCHVCRYLLVEALDPSQHGAIDRLYTDIYPMRF